VLAAEHLLELRLLDAQFERFEGGVEVLLDVLAPSHPVGEDLGIVLLRPQALQQREVGLDALAPLEDLLGCALVLPELGLGGLLVEAPQLVLELALLKDSRGRPRPSRPVVRSAG